MIILGRVDLGRRSGSGRRNDGIIHEKRIAGEKHSLVSSHLLFCCANVTLTHSHIHIHTFTHLT